ncbi:hypothetical protein RMCBS344292_15795 [Rhizopus microsporus]|nr:hypothetical protein RMCBS344292_15795 [Rhizopus microsporus]
MVNDLDWYEYDAHEEVAFETHPFQDESVDGPYAKKKSVSREAFDGITGMVNSHVKKYSSKSLLLYSHSKLRGSIINSFPVKVREHNVCKNGCALFGSDDSCDKRSECGENRDSARKMKYLSLIEQLALLVSNDGALELMKSSNKYEKD